EHRGGRHHADVAGGRWRIVFDGSGCRCGICTRVGDCDHAFNLWTAARVRHGVFPRTCRGKTPASVTSAFMVTGDERQLLSYLGPNWFASVMGTGIVATAAASLPVHVPGLRVFAQVVWVIAVAWMVILIVTVGANWMRHPTVARS